MLLLATAVGCAGLLGMDEVTSLDDVSDASAAGDGSSDDGAAAGDGATGDGAVGADGGPNADAAAPCDLTGPYLLVDGNIAVFGVPTTVDFEGKPFDESSARPLPDGCFAVSREATGFGRVVRMCLGVAAADYLVATDAGPSLHLSVHPDGKTIAVALRQGNVDAGRDIMTGTYDGGLLALTPMPNVNVSLADDTDPHFDADGTLYFVRPVTDTIIDGGTATFFGIFALPPGGGTPYRVSFEGPAMDRRLPTPSPDGRLYYRTNNINNDSQIAWSPKLADGGFGAATTLITDDDPYPAGISPNGCTLYVRKRTPGCSASTCRARVVEARKPPKL